MVDFGKKEAVFFGVIICLAVLVFLASAYGGNDPVKVGHSAGEIEGIIPSGAVMAFDLAACPAGWSELTDARGRVVVGMNSADGNFDSRGEVGGEKSHTLTIAEMPSHSHTERTWSDATGYGWRPSSGWAKAVTLNSGGAGGDGAHNNLQPYVTFLYCKKN